MTKATRNAAIIAAVESGKSLAEVARIHGITYECVRVICHRAGLMARRSAERHAAKRAALLDKVEAGEVVDAKMIQHYGLRDAYDDAAPVRRKMRRADYVRRTVESIVAAVLASVEATGYAPSLTRLPVRPTVVYNTLGRGGYQEILRVMGFEKTPYTRNVTTAQEAE